MSDPVEFDPREWRQLTELLSLEQKGLLMEICCYEWDSGLKLYAIDSHAAKAISVNINKYKKVLASLIVEGLITINDDGLNTPYSNSDGL